MAKARKSKTQDKRPGRIMNCWEYRGCGREIGGSCPAVTQNMGNRCWNVVGTMCDGEVQGSFAKKLESCIHCGYYQAIHETRSEGELTHLSLNETFGQAGEFLGNNYVIRVYRRTGKSHEELIGILEDVRNGIERPFRNVNELCEMLAMRHGICRRVSNVKVEHCRRIHGRP